MGAARKPDGKRVPAGAAAPAGSWTEPTGALVTPHPELYRLLVETVRDYAIFALDPQGHVLTWNAGAQRIKGYTPEEIIGRHYSTFYPPEAVAAGKPQQLLRVAAEAGRVEDQGWRVRKDGTRFWADVVITALRTPGGELVGFAKVTRDLTERRAAQERALADARRLAEAEAASHAKSEFLAAMSHELRTPLNAIGGYTDLLLGGVRGPITASQREDLERIRRSQRHLLGIITDLLNFSRIEAGRISYQIEPVTLREVLDAVVPVARAQAEPRGVTVEMAPCRKGVVASGDRAKIEQIVLNLLTNAVKFTPRGGRVVASCTRDRQRAVIDVRDSGVGIPQEKLQVIFEPFVQLNRSLTTLQEGTGLGLAISRDLARAMNGDLEAESELGKGSRFRLILPRA